MYMDGSRISCTENFKVYYHQHRYYVQNQDFNDEGSRNTSKLTYFKTAKE